MAEEAKDKHWALTEEGQQQRQETGRSDIESLFANTDMLERLPEGLPFIPLPFPKGSIFGSTNFEEKLLNDMIDMVEGAKPSDLEDAGDALKKTTEALNKAAKELDDFIKSTDWKSDGATEFQRYGKEVVKYTWDLGAYANAVGAQMKVASTGLASVRNAMPARDDRAEPKPPERFSAEKKTPDNAEYQKAIQKEKDRQEAINQMNRLASFYVVSRTTLEKQPEPQPPSTLKAAVPPPMNSVRTGTASDSRADSGDFSRVSSERGGVAENEARDTGGVSRVDVPGRTPTVPDTSVEIDSVTTPPPPTTTAPGTPPTAPAGPPNGSGPVLPTVGPVGPPVRGVPPRATGGPPVPKTGRPSPTALVGRPAPTGSGPTTAGRTTGPVGRAGMPGTSATSPVGRPGPTGSGPTTAGRTTGPVGRAGMPGTSATSPVGRPGATGTGPGVSGRPGPVGAAGQTPVAGRPTATGQPNAGRSGGSAGHRAARADGIVGGTPQRTTGGSAGARIPRGTVIGGEGAVTGRASTARPGQAGVIGTNATNGARPTGRGTPSTNGVVGTPRSNATGSRPAAGSGRPSQRRPEDEDQDGGSTRPDHLTEDEETWAARRRGAVPPVID